MDLRGFTGLYHKMAWVQDSPGFSAFPRESGFQVSLPGHQLVWKLKPSPSAVAGSAWKQGKSCASRFRGSWWTSNRRSTCGMTSQNQRRPAFSRSRILSPAPAC